MLDPPQTSLGGIVDEDIVMIDVDDALSDGSDFYTLTEADQIPETSVSQHEHPPPPYSTLPSTPPRPAIEPATLYSEIAKTEPAPSKNVLRKSNKPENPPHPLPYNSQSMCTICKLRPVFSDGTRVFPTCGSTCAQKYDAHSNVPQSTVMQGFMNNHQHSYNTRSGSSSDHPFSWHTQPPLRRPHIGMCAICGVRPKCQRGGKTYPTCGLTCAAKLHPLGTVEMCDFCKKRPKVVINGKTYPQCGRTCRDNAKIATAAAASSATCKTCLVCWKANKYEDDDICSLACTSAADSRAPFLIEVPRGHVAFNKVAGVFADSWKISKTETVVPDIKRIHMVHMKVESIAKQKQYLDQVNASGLFRKKTKGSRSWLGIPRGCGFGDSGNMEPCLSVKCILCSITRSSVSREIIQGGILTTGSLPRAVEAASVVRNNASQVVLLASVALGKIAESSEAPSLPPTGYHSVHLVAHTNRAKFDYDEHLVYDVDAIKPRYLITFE